MKKQIPDDVMNRVLHSVQRPGRYTGGEYGSAPVFSPLKLNILLSYPDLYEIGMSNISIKILYGLFNSLENVTCERVFAPAPDFEEILRKLKIPLFSLESRIPLSEFDIIGFSVAYELTFTNILNILDLGGISPVASNRTYHDPIIIIGGPSTINPIPYGSFSDAVFIGEAENWSQEVFPELADLKLKGAGRDDLLKVIYSSPYIWHRGKKGNTKRAIWNGFGGSKIPVKTESKTAVKTPVVVPALVPNFKTVQDHGIVEIMRGCPHNCRFCSASIFYRPYRQMDFDRIVQQIDYQIFSCGYREVTLSSLSSGDYHGIFELIRYLNNRYRQFGVSFSFPSLRINTFAIDLLSEISSVRKSGLTFAVETPKESWQNKINKIVSIEKTIDLLKKAKNAGWRSAKFYFMIGLPVIDSNGDASDEAESILDFINEVYSAVRINMNINVSVFIPKPHTPFQWSKQLEEEAALNTIYRIKDRVVSKSIKIRYHSPFLSFLESIISRGDDRAGWLFYNAFLQGARLDAWDDFVNKNLWRDIIKSTDWDVRKDTYRERKQEEKLPWDSIKLGISKNYLLKEYEKSKKGVITPDCMPNCSIPCGVCNKNIRVIESKKNIKDIPNLASNLKNPCEMLICFQKYGRLRYISHLDLMTIFDRSLFRAGFYPVMSKGFNPKAKLEFASPLSLGISSEEEIMAARTFNCVGCEIFKEKLNKMLPSGLKIIEVLVIKELIDYNEKNIKKRKSLMSLYWGSEFLIKINSQFCETIFALIKNNMQNYPGLLSVEKDSRGIRITIKQLERGNKNILKILEELTGPEPFPYGISITRTKTYAKDIYGKPVSYFKLFGPSSDFT